MQRASSYLMGYFIGILILIAMVILFLPQQNYMMISFILIILMMVPFFIRFELKVISTREIVILSVLAAIAAVSRVPFASLPSIQPTSFVIIICGLVFGAESGFIVGAIAAFVSNIFLGQGPWTPWQMFTWGMMGMTAGVLKDYIWFKTKVSLSIFGFIWGFLFGWIMNIWVVLSQFEAITWQQLIAIYSASFYFDLAHSLCNVFFLVLFTKSWLSILNRFQIKYGLLLNKG